MAYKYKNAAAGGTFDLMHKGHESLLEKAFSISQFVTIGITSDKFAKEKNVSQNQNERRKNVLGFLNKKNFSKRTKLIFIDDVYGNAQKDKTLQAIIVSYETAKNAQLINKKRLQNDLKKLTIITCPTVLAKDKKPISTTRIKNGEISPNGQVYKNLLYKIANRQISQSARTALKNPLSKVATIEKSLKFEKNLIAVGDISVANLLKLGILPKISVVDFYVERKLAFQSLTQLGFGSANPDVIVKNEAGQISKALIDQIEKAQNGKNSSVILVNGEEDLAAIPAILLAPVGATVVYGQPQKGAVIVNVNTNIKDKLCSILGLNT